MMRLCRVLAFASFAVTLTVTAASGRPDLPSKLDGAVSAEVPKGFSGAVLVARGRSVLLENGYGTIGGIPVRPNSKFWIASAGKQFTAAAIMRCRDKKLLTLDDPLSRFLPSAPADKRDITVRQLLAHTSGLDQTYASEGAKSRDEAVAHMLSRPLIDKPGKAFHYSNDNYQLSAAIVEIVSRREYKDFVRRELFAPAGLRDTGFANDTGAQGVLPGRSTMSARLTHTEWGAEGVYSTATDLLRWYQALRSGQIVSRDSASAMFSPAVNIKEGTAGLGWFIGRSPRGAMQVFVRGNEDWGPNSLLYSYPASGVSIVVLTHAGDADGDLSWSRFILAKLQEVLGL